MAGQMSKPKKRPATYGKATRKILYAKPVDLDSEDELTSTDDSLKPAYQKLGKATVTTPPSSETVTPPISPSASITSPASSSGTKRASPFSDDLVVGRTSKIRVVSRSSRQTPENDIFDEIVPKNATTKRKPVPKLKKNVPPALDTSDDTQIMLDNQLLDFSPREPVARTTSVPVKKGGLKMPTRTRVVSGPATTLSSRRAKQVEVVSVQTQPIKEASPPVVIKDSPLKTATRRPRTPQKKAASQPLPTIFSPSNLDLEELEISTSQPERARTPEAVTLVSLVVSPPRASPARPKLKDRLTSDLSNMVNELDVSMEDTITSPATSFSSRHDQTTSTNQKPDNQDSQGSTAYSQTSQAPGPKVTYGATRWTFLPDEDTEMAGMDSILDSQDSINGKRSRQLPTLAKSSSRIDEFEMDDDEEESTAVVRSLHELKQAGGTQRMTRQIEALLDDIENSSTKTQRISALLELISKLRQASFLRQFVDTGSEARFLNMILMMDSLVLKALFSVAVLVLLQSPNLASVSVETELIRLLTLLTGLLTKTMDLTAESRLRRSAATKDGQKQIENLYGQLTASSIWPESKPTILTPRIIALTTMERLVRKLRESGYQFEALYGGVSEDLMELVTQWQSDADEDIQLSTTLALSTLESASLAYSTAIMEKTGFWTVKTGKTFIGFCPRLFQSGNLFKNANLVFLTLRLCLNLSNAEAKTLKLFADADFIKSTVETTNKLFGQLSIKNQFDQNLVMDNLILSLGLLINLAERSDAARNLFVHGSTQNEMPIDILLQIFTSRLQSAFDIITEEEIRSNVPFGYLAVLLGYLCRHHAILQRVRKRLDGGNLRVLLIAIGEFLQYHQKVEELGQSEGGQEITIPFINRLQDLMKDLQAQE